MEFSHVVVLITAPSAETGQEIAAALLERKLAACVSLTTAPVRSLYTWQGQSADEEEVLLIVKTRADLFETKLVPAVQAIHPYETPEIIALPIVMGAKGYLDWIDGETKGE